MKIGYVVGIFPSDTETFVAREIEGIKQSGLPVAVFALKRPGFALSGTISSTETLADVEYARPDGVARQVAGNLAAFVRHPVRYLAALRVFAGELMRVPPSIAPRLMYHFAWGIDLSRRARRQGVDHLHCHFSSATNAALAAHLYSGISFSFTAHASGDIFVAPILLRKKTQCAAMVIAVCEYSRRYLDAVTHYEYSDKIFRVYNGVDADETGRPAPEDRPPSRDEGSKPDALRLLSVGSLLPIKGFMTLVDTCVLLRESGQNFHCTIIGDGPDLLALQNRIRAAGVTDVVHLTGYLPTAGVYAAMHDADVFVLLSEISVSGYRDGFPTVILEAMATQLPVVSTWISGIPELVEDGVTGMLVPERDPQAAAQALLRLSNDDTLQQRFGAAGREKLLRSFSATGATARLHELFVRVHDSGSGNRPPTS